MATQQEYLEQDRLVRENTLVVQSWLENFAKARPEEIGTAFYSDVTILSGPHGNYFWNTDAGKELNKRYQSGEIEIYCVKWADASFIIEYKFDGDRFYRYRDMLFTARHKTAVDAYFLYNGRRFSVPMDVVTAAKNLYSAQEYRSVLFANLRDKAERSY